MENIALKSYFVKSSNSNQIINTTNDLIEYIIIVNEKNQVKISSKT